MIMIRGLIPGLLLHIILTGCSSGGAGGGGQDGSGGGPGDAAALGDLRVVEPPDLRSPADLMAGPSPEQCLEGWRMYGGACPAPTISESYVGYNCVGTTGWFILGRNFQLEQRNMGIADYGPQSIGANGDQKHWNVITTTQLCVTVSAQAKGAWVGKTIYVKNPDGKSSNSVVVQDKL